MKIDMQKLLREHRISTEGKHKTPGWINVRCPFCDDQSNHLGWNVEGQYWSCYKCGNHRTDETLSELLCIAESEVWILCKRYAMRPSAIAKEEAPEITRPEKCIVPGDLIVQSPAVDGHALYLESRGYDPYPLVKLWGLRGTGHLAQGTNKFRIICPIYYNGQIVSWQGRDITGRSPLRWKSCPSELELRPHKHCLGGQQLVPGDSVAVVEGFTDAWRLGPGAVCTFGVDYLLPQINLLRAYRRRFIVLDSKAKDPNAAKQAGKLAAMLSAFPGETIMVELDEGDPGDMKQNDADALMRSFGFKR